jgi:hypothetical protein
VAIPPRQIEELPIKPVESMDVTPPELSSVLTQTLLSSSDKSSQTKTKTKENKHTNYDPPPPPPPPPQPPPLTPQFAQPDPKKQLKKKIVQTNPQKQLKKEITQPDPKKPLKKEISNTSKPNKLPKTSDSIPEFKPTLKKWDEILIPEKKSVPDPPLKDWGRTPKSRFNPYTKKKKKTKKMVI